MLRATSMKQWGTVLKSKVAAFVAERILFLEMAPTGDWPGYKASGSRAVGDSLLNHLQMPGCCSSQAAHSGVQCRQLSAVLAGQGEEVSVGELLMPANLRQQRVIELEIVRPEFVRRLGNPCANRSQSIGRAGGIVDLGGDPADSKLRQGTGRKTADTSKPLLRLAVFNMVWPAQGDHLLSALVNPQPA